MRMERVLLAALLLGAAGCAGEAADVRIRVFELERAEPPADASGERIVVQPRSDLHFRWRIEGDPVRLSLTANERAVVSWSGGTLPLVAANACSAARCATDRIGEVVYRLEAWDADGRSDVATLPVRVAELGLLIQSFTSEATSVDRGSDVTLAWESPGAVQARLEATPIGGGPTRSLGTFSGEAAAANTVVDRTLVESTIYHLTVEDDRGREASADLAVTLRGEAWITSLAAEPASAAPGEPVRLSWTSVGLDRLTIVRDDGGASITDVADDELDAGEREVRIDQTTTFTFVGISREGLLVSDLCDATGCRPAKLVVARREGPAVLSFAADEAELEAGAGTTLRWQVANADQVEITWADATSSGALPIPAGATAVAIAPADTVRYTLVATGAGRTASRQTEVGVRPAVELAGPARVAPGATFEVAWTTRGASGVELLVDGRPVSTGSAVDSGAVELKADEDATPGSFIEVRLIARDDETPRRTTERTLQIEVDAL